jgi:hypothetical protein
MWLPLQGSQFSIFGAIEFEGPHSQCKKGILKLCKNICMFKIYPQLKKRNHHYRCLLYNQKQNQIDSKMPENQNFLIFY